MYQILFTCFSVGGPMCIQAIHHAIFFRSQLQAHTQKPDGRKPLVKKLCPSVPNKNNEKRLKGCPGAG